jgi:uncharacterized membrane protein
VGISLVISDQRYQRLYPNQQVKERFKKTLFRGMLIFSCGMLITVITYLYPHQGFIRFGVLHCIGVSIVLSFWFVRNRWLAAITGIMFIIIGILFRPLSVDTSLLLWLGLKPVGFYTLDYFPLLPWFGVILLGIGLGNTLYNKYSRNYQLVDLSENGIVKTLSFIGRHSLMIYLLHQPVILLLLYPLIPSL